MLGGPLPGGDSERAWPPCACCTHAFPYTLCRVTRECLCWGGHATQIEIGERGRASLRSLMNIINTGLRAVPSLCQ